jgi:thioester reductase-like protein
VVQRHAGRRKKPLHFVSTVAVGLGQGVGLVTEDMMGSKLQARRDVGAGYAGGYSGSK